MIVLCTVPQQTLAPAPFACKTLLEALRKGQRAQAWKAAGRYGCYGMVEEFPQGQVLKATGKADVRQALIEQKAKDQLPWWIWGGLVVALVMIVSTLPPIHHKRMNNEPYCHITIIA